MVDGLKARQQKDWMDSLSSSLLLPLLGHRHGPNACVKRKCEQEVSANRGQQQQQQRQEFSSSTRGVYVMHSGGMHMCALKERQAPAQTHS